MSKKKKTYIWLIAIAVLIVAIVAISIARHGRSQVVVNSQPVTRGSIETTVTATGEIQPVYKVEVGTQVSGIIEKLYVDYNSTVTKGQLLAELDKSLLQEQVKQAQANLSTTTSNKQLAEKNYNRIKSLYDKKAATQEEYDQAETNLAQANNQLITAQSDYDRARTNLKYAEIYSPIDGIVLDRAVEVGQTVAASFSTPTLFTLANDLTKMQVEADVDEADIGQVKEGQKVTFTVDAYMDDVFDGTVNQIRMKPTTTSNVVTYTVIIDAPNPDQKLFPGMTASVTIVTEEQTGLAVPAEAFNFTPDEQVLKALRKPEPPQGGKPEGEHPSREEGEAVASSRSMVWLKNGDQMMPRPVKTGMSDGAYKIIEQGVQAGDSVVLSAQFVVKEKAKKTGENPFMPGPPGRNRNNSSQQKK